MYSLLSKLLKKNLHKGFLLATFAVCTGAFAQQQGSFKAFKDKLNANKSSSNSRTESSLSFNIEGKKHLAQVKGYSVKGGLETYAGKIAGSGKAEFHIIFAKNKAKGFVLFYDSLEAYEFKTSDDGIINLEPRKFEEIVAVDNFQIQPANTLSQNGTPGVTSNGTVIPLLQSTPGSNTVVYLDFDGEIVSNTAWNGGATINGAKPQGSEANIRTIWEMMSEDFSPFNINVTTSRAVYDAAAPGRRQMVIFTPTSDAAPGAGGVAFINGFSWTADLPCWVFITPVDAANAAEAGSHEVGHTFGLNHDGRDLATGREEYYNGHNNWAPIMGVAYGKQVSQFSKGEYDLASNKEDDLSIITSSTNGIGYKTDDIGNSAATATTLNINNLSASISGLISTTNDVDFIRIASPGYVANINISNKISSYSNLNIAATIYNDANQIIASSNPTNSQGVQFTNLSLPSGNYYIAIDGVGENTASIGYTDYGSIGEYVLTASFSSVSGCTDPAWISTQAYNGGDKVSYNNNLYKANWWTKGDQPDLNNGPVGTGKPWTIIGTCAAPADPKVSISAPISNSVAYFYPSANPLVNVTVNVNSNETKIDSVRFIIVELFCNGPGCANVRYFTVKNAPFSLSYVPSLKGTGYTQVNAIAFSGTKASQTATLDFYAKPLPELTIVSPSDNVSISRATTSLLIDVNVNTENMPIDSVVYTVYDTKTTGMSGITTSRKFVKSAPYDFNLPIIAGNTFSKVFALAYGDGGKFSVSKSIQINYNDVPQVVIIQPVVGARYNVGGSITVKANISDIDGQITKVEIYSPHIPNSTIVLTAAPFEATFSNLPSSGIRGATTFVVKATDDKNGVNGASIDVIENKTPQVSITSPLPVNSINPKYLVGGSVSITTNVTDQDGSIAKVEFVLNKSNQVITVTSAPFGATFTNLPAPYPDGSLDVTVKAYDNEGAIGTSQLILYKNRVPTITITNPVANATFATGSNITITGLVYDPDLTSAKVEYFVGSNKVAESTVAPYSVVWNAVTAGNYSITAKVTDDMGESATSSIVNIVVGSTCTAQTWNAATAYNTGAQVQYSGIRYRANWWTQNQRPDQFNGGSGTGQPWTSLGSCNTREEAASALESLSIQPSPFSEVLFINAEGSNAKVSLYDLMGILHAEKSFSNAIQLNTALLGSGIYVCKIDINGVVKTYTLMKQ